MRLPILLLEAGLILSGICHAQSQGDSSAPTVPVGQTILKFEFPVYQEGKLHYTLAATEAKGITLNRAETTDLRIDIYDNGAPTTTITSPKADLYVAEQKMRTKSTVQIERADLEATSQECDFDVKAKKFWMRKKVSVLLKHFDMGKQSSGLGATPTSTPAPVPAPQPSDMPPAPAPAQLPAPAMSSTPSAPAASATPDPTPVAHGTDSLLASPGSFSDTNSAPIPPSK